MTRSWSSKDTSDATVSRLWSRHCCPPALAKGCCCLEEPPPGQGLGHGPRMQGWWISILAPVVGGRALPHNVGQPPTREGGSEGSVQKEWKVSALRYKQIPLKTKTQCGVVSTQREQRGTCSPSVSELIRCAVWFYFRAWTHAHCMALQYTYLLELRISILILGNERIPVSSLLNWTRGGHRMEALTLSDDWLIT